MLTFRRLLMSPEFLGVYGMAYKWIGQRHSNNFQTHPINITLKSTLQVARRSHTATKQTFGLPNYTTVTSLNSYRKLKKCTQRLETNDFCLGQNPCRLLIKCMLPFFNGRTSTKRSQSTSFRTQITCQEKKKRICSTRNVTIWHDLAQVWCSTRQHTGLSHSCFYADDFELQDES